MATKVAGLRLWDETIDTAVSKDLIIETKLNDFGNPLYKKSIYGFYVNVTQGSSNKIFHLSLMYRENTTDAYQYLGFNYNLSSSSSSDTNGSHYFERTFPSIPLYTMQVKLVGSYIAGNVGINDFGIMYRQYRDVQKDRFDDTE